METDANVNHISREPKINQSQLCEWIGKIAFGICKDPFFGITMLLVYLLSLIKTEVCNYGTASPSFALAIIGTTGSRKTSCAKVLFNPVNLNSCSFEDSPAAINRILKENRCACSIIDDFNCRSSAKTKIFEEKIRLCGDSTSNAKRVINGKVDNSHTGMAVFTGENYPVLQESSYHRILFLNFEKDTVQNDVLSEIQHNNGKYNEFCIRFLEWFYTDQTIAETFMDDVERQRTEISKTEAFSSLHGRYAEMYAWLITVYRLLNEYLDSPLAPPNFDYESNLTEVLTNQAQRFTRSLVHMYITAFQYLLENNGFEVQEYNNHSNNFDILEKVDIYYVKCGTVYEKIVRYYQDKGISDFDISERSLRNTLFSEGILKKPFSGNNLTFQVQHKGGSSQTYMLYKTKIFKK